MEPQSDQASSKKRALLAAFEDAMTENGFAPKGYEIIEELDRGGMAVVYQARQLNPEREIALKVMLPKYANQENMRIRFQREARAMATLEHPAIMPIYEVGESDQMMFFSMKLAEGGSLADKLQEDEPPSLRDSVDWLIAISEAVHYAHQRGILHRDLKPGNFLFDERGQIYVSDFGVAKMLLGEDGGITRAEAFIGTPNYMPPELAGGASAEASVAGDLYSLGAVFYECLTGERPHNSHTNVATLLRAIVDEEISSPRSLKQSIPIDLDVICKKALEKDPAARYSSVLAFRDDLVRWKEGHAIRARPVNWFGHLTRWTKRHPLPTALILAMVGLGISNVYSNYQRGRLIHDQFIKEARFERRDAEPGFRERGLKQLREAAKLRESPEIRNQAAALLAKFDVTTGAGMRHEVPSPPLEILKNKTIQDWKASPQGEHVISYHTDGHATLWEVESGRQLHHWSYSAGLSVQADFVQNGILVVQTAEQLNQNQEHILNARVSLFTGKDFKESRQIQIPGEESFLYLSICSGGRYAALAGENGLKVLDVLTQELRSSPSQQGKARCRPAWSLDCRTIAVALGEEPQIVIYDINHLEKAVEYRTKRWASQLAFHPDGRILALARSDQVISLIDVFESNLITTLPFDFKDPGTLSFNNAGDRLSFSAKPELPWRLEPAIAYHEWRPSTIIRSNSTVFESRLSPNEEMLLTVTNHGLEIWSLKEKRQIGFYPSGNQRIDVRSAALWLNNGEILLQIPGGLEAIHCDDHGTLSFHRNVKRTPRARVLEVFKNGDWLVRQPEEEEGESSFWIWPQGDSSLARISELSASEEEDFHFVTADDLSLTAKVQANGTIQLKGKYDLSLIPAAELEIHQIILKQESSLLIAVSRDGKTVSWDLPALDRALEEQGF